MHDTSDDDDDDTSFASTDGGELLIPFITLLVTATLLGKYTVISPSLSSTFRKRAHVLNLVILYLHHQCINCDSGQMST